MGYERDTPLLEGVSLELRRGELVALMGENGAGKSTLVKHFNGLLKPFRGAVPASRQGRRPRCRSPRRRAPAPCSARTRTTTSSATPSPPRSISRSRTSSSTAPAATSSRRGSSPSSTSPGCSQRDPRDLSGGERTRVALAAVACGDPPLVVLDEPTRGMDPTRKGELARTLRRWVADGRCVLVVTHDVEFAARCATRVVVLGDGGDPRRRTRRRGAQRLALLLDPGEPAAAPRAARRPARGRGRLGGRRH